MNIKELQLTILVMIGQVDSRAVIQQLSQILEQNRIQQHNLQMGFYTQYNSGYISDKLRLLDSVCRIAIQNTKDLIRIQNANQSIITENQKLKDDLCNICGLNIQLDRDVALKEQQIERVRREVLVLATQIEKYRQYCQLQKSTVSTEQQLSDALAEIETLKRQKQQLRTIADRLTTIVCEMQENYHKKTEQVSVQQQKKQENLDLKSLTSEEQSIEQEEQILLIDSTPRFRSLAHDIASMDESGSNKIDEADIPGQRGQNLRRQRARIFVKQNINKLQETIKNIHFSGKVSQYLRSTTNKLTI